MVDEAAQPLFAWLEPPLREALGLHAANAILLHGPDGNGQFDLALALAKAFLCEAQRDPGAPTAACSSCAGCRLFASRTHPDLMILVPDALREALGWPAPITEDSASAGAAAKSKPSKEIKVDDVRAVVAFTQSSSARGMGKVVVVHPAERMNLIAANGLLKTLEEPAGQTRHILSSMAVELILPTVRSRCLAVQVALPSEESALAWLASKNVSQPPVMLAATGGRPIESLQWALFGVDAALWLSLPRQISQGKAAALAEWPLARVIEALQKLCHDCLCLAVGGSPRYFPKKSLVAAGEVSRLLEWASALREHARHAEHPWHGALKVDHLVEQARRAMQASHSIEDPAKPGSLGRASLHSKP